MDNELYHHGVPGMHWHTRRGSSTSISKTRSISTGKKKIDVSKMSDEELRKRVNRLQMEQQYKSLSPAKVSKGELYTKNFMKAATAATVATSTALTLYNNAGKIKDIVGKIVKRSRG